MSTPRPTFQIFCCKIELAEKMTRIQLFTFFLQVDNNITNVQLYTHLIPKLIKGEVTWDYQNMKKKIKMKLNNIIK